MESIGDSIEQTYLVSPVLHVVRVDLNFQMVLEDPREKNENRSRFQFIFFILPVVLWDRDHQGDQENHWCREGPVILDRNDSLEEGKPMNLPGRPARPGLPSRPGYPAEPARPGRPFWPRSPSCPRGPVVPIPELKKRPIDESMIKIFKWVYHRDRVDQSDQLHQVHLFNNKQESSSGSFDSNLPKAWSARWTIATRVTTKTR